MPDRQLENALEALRKDVRSSVLDRDRLAEHVRHLTSLLSTDQQPTTEQHHRTNTTGSSSGAHHKRQSLSSIPVRSPQASSTSRPDRSPPAQRRKVTTEQRHDEHTPVTLKKVDLNAPKASDATPAVVDDDHEDDDQDLSSDPAWARMVALLEDATLKGQHALASPVASTRTAQYDSGDEESIGDTTTVATTVYPSIRSTSHSNPLSLELARALQRTPSPTLRRRLRSPAPLSHDTDTGTIEHLTPDHPPAYHRYEGTASSSVDAAAIRRGADPETAAVISAARAWRQNSTSEADLSWVEAFEASLLAGCATPEPKHHDSADNATEDGSGSASIRLLTVILVVILACVLSVGADGLWWRFSPAIPNGQQVSCHCTCPLPIPSVS